MKKLWLCLSLLNNQFKCSCLRTFGINGHLWWPGGYQSHVTVRIKTISNIATMKVRVFIQNIINANILKTDLKDYIKPFFLLFKLIFTSLWSLMRVTLHCLLNSLTRPAFQVASKYKIENCGLTNERILWYLKIRSQ